MTRFAASTSHTFVSLTPGTHFFTVKTIDQEGNSDGTQVSASFTVDAPFWQTLWFILPTAIGTIGIAIAGSIAYRRNRQWKRVQAQLVGEMERELQVAQRLQNELLPQSDPVIPGLEITGTCMAASRVGGDYFTYLWSDSEHQRIGVVIADVTGHAMQAAIPAVLFSGMLATASRQTERPGVILRILNEALVTRVGANTFICCTIAVFDVEKSQLTLANAGGLDPVRLSDGVTEPVCVSGNRLPLGVVPDLDYSECEVTLSPGDLVVFVSDGIVEAKSPTGELFGFARVADGANRWKTAADARQGLLNEVSSFMEARDQDDDITVIAVRVLDDPARVET
jgi:serine phosphatase RsbU (regulator of sigma subunit)